LSRFNKLYPEIKRETKDERVDPFEILHDSRERKQISIPEATEDQKENYSVLRMAARKNISLPDHIIDKMKQKHKDDEGDKSED
jgi:hypothetical protein